MEETFYRMPDTHREAFNTYFLQEIVNNTSGIEAQLKRIANSLEQTGNKTKEEMLNKVKQELLNKVKQELEE